MNTIEKEENSHQKSEEQESSILLQEYVQKRKEELIALQNYAKRLELFAVLKSEKPYSNKNHEHAAIALSTILKHARNEFVIFDDNLHGDIAKHEEVLSFKDSVIAFLSGGGKLRIVIGDKFDDDSIEFKRFLRVLLDVFSQNVRIKIANDDFKNEIKNKYVTNINFAIGDSRMYRLEKYEKPEDKDRSAVVCFNDVNKSKELLSVFNKNFDKCDNYF